MQRNRGKQKNGKDQKTLQENYTKETFQAKTGTIKERNGKDLTEAEEIKKRWQEYTEELQKEGLNEPDNHDGVVTQNQTSWNVKSSGSQEALREQCQ